MARLTSLIIFGLLVITCGGRVTTSTSQDMGGQAGVIQGTGGPPPIVGGTTGGGGSSIVACGNVLCPPGDSCCSPSCGICVSPGAACDPVICASPGLPGSGGSSNPSMPGAGGASVPGAGGSGAFVTEPQCVAQLFSFCEEGLGACLCNSCLAEAAACSADSGCQAIFYCATVNNCTDTQDCLSKCGGVISAHAASLPLALKVTSCASAKGCTSPQCRLSFVDAGPACAPPPAVGTPICTRVGSANDAACGFSCRDNGRNEYHSKCDAGSRSCTCFYNGTPSCTCSYSIAPGCRDCCPPWGLSQ